MVTKISMPSREQFTSLHEQITADFNDMKDVSNGKNIQKILDKLAEKYGYSSGQAVRNVINNLKKKKNGDN